MESHRTHGMGACADAAAAIAAAAACTACTARPALHGLHAARAEASVASVATTSAARNAAYVAAAPDSADAITNNQTDRIRQVSGTHAGHVRCASKRVLELQRHIRIDAYIRQLPMRGIAA